LFSRSFIKVQSQSYSAFSREMTETLDSRDAELRGVSEFRLHDDTLASIAMTTARSQRFVLSSGSPAMENDYVRFARATKHGPLAVATGFAIFAVLYVVLYLRVVQHQQDGVNAASYFATIAVLASTAAVLVTLWSVEKRQLAAAGADSELYTRELCFARIIEAIPAVSLGVGIVCLELSWPWNRHAECAHWASVGHNSERECYSSLSLSTLMFTYNAVFVTPRIVPWIAPTSTLIVMCKITGTVIAAVDPELSAASPLTLVDHIALTLMFVAVVAPFTIVAIGLERTARAHFMSVVQQQRARGMIDLHATAVRTMLSSAVPEQLLDTALLPEAQNMAHYSTHAACVIANIHSFAEWSTGLLVSDVVEVLHQTLTAFDVGIADFPDMMRGMAYGDSYVAVCGLVSDAVDPAAAGCRFAHWQLETAMQLAAAHEHPFATRVCVACGSLVGGVVGDKAKRYVVTGQALERAQESIRVCEPNTVIIVETDVTVPKDRSASTRRVTLSALQVGGRSSSLAVTESSGTDAMAYSWSALWLTFDDPTLQLAFAASKTDTTTTPTVALLVLFTLLLAVTSIEHITNRVQDNTPVLMGAAVVLALVDLLHRSLLRTHVPVGVPAVLVFLTLSVAAVALALSTSLSIDVEMRWIAIGWFDHLPRARWWLTAVIVLFALIPPLTYRRLAVGAGGPLSLPLASALVVAATVLVVLQTRGLARAACVRFVAAAIAADAVAHAEQCVTHQEATLAGLLPRHARPDARAVATAALRAGAEFVQFVDQLSVLQLELSGVSNRGGGDSSGDGGDIAADTFRAVAVCWGLMNDAVRVSNGILELVQATGDSYIVAGPFGRGSDGAYHAAARATMLLLHELPSRFGNSRHPRTFTAVATAGSASGALLGASKLAYRLFGGAVRESTALLEAAPRMPDAFQRNAAFASEAFRRLYCSATARCPRHCAMQEAMSVALRSDGESLTDTAKDGVGIFCSRLMWRVRGVGSASVSCINLQHVDESL
jgi:hypothetical protein